MKCKVLGSDIGIISRLACYSTRDRGRHTKRWRHKRGIMTDSALARTILKGFVIASAFAFTPLWAQQQPQKFIQIVDDFSRGSAGWLATFTDYSLNDDSISQRIAEVRALPAEVDSTRRGYYLQAVNGSDDLFSYLKKPLTIENGIEPNATYNVEFLVEFASNAAAECFGVGGAPGLAVDLKVGASGVEPVQMLVGREVTLNLDKGEQHNGGADATLAGNIGVPISNCNLDTPPFALAERRVVHAHPVQASSYGWLWLFVGTDSGYEGLNQLYFSRIIVTLTRVEGGAQ